MTAPTRAGDEPAVSLPKTQQCCHCVTWRQVIGVVVLFFGTLLAYGLSAKQPKDKKVIIIKSPSNRPESPSKNVTKKVDPEIQKLYDSIDPRAFQKFKGDRLPCFTPNPDWRDDGSPAEIGLFFAKPYKVGSSTASGVHTRIARNVADRYGKDYPICALRWSHNNVYQKFRNRDRKQSLIWTILRDPTNRLVSLFYHFKVARGLRNGTTADFIDVIRGEYKRTQTSYYLTSQSHVGGSETSPKKRIESIINDMDFIGITERMDESVVALAMLWGLPLADVLYFSAKRLGSWDGGGGGWGCHKILKGVRQPGMQEFIDSPEFQNMVRYDNVAYQLANKSLDLTIEHTIGREKFDKALAKFKKAKQVAEEECSKEVTFPCDDTLKPSKRPNGQIKIEPRPYEETDCMTLDNGCGYMCLDDVASELDLWEPEGELHYKFPGAFGLGPSSQKRLKARVNGLPKSQMSSLPLSDDVESWTTGYERLKVPAAAKRFKVEQDRMRMQMMKKSNIPKRKRVN